jgi:predicted pyridoxine 5'-phosphate oxidase superfamily flavin-nucleotide-binding protein
MFLVPGSNTVVRINGRAVVTTAAGLVTSFEQNGKHPRSIIQITIAEVYFQCAKALMRSKTWTAGDQSAGLPTPGQLVREQVSSFDATDYDTHYAARAVDRMW